MLLLLFGLATAVYGSYNYYRISEAKSWPYVEGVILESGIEHSTNDGRNKYRAKIKYSYSVGVDSYLGYRIGFTGGVSLEHAESVTKRFPVGRMVKVFYNEIKPNASVLSTELTLLASLLPWLGVAFMVIPCFLLWFNNSNTNK